MVNELRWENPNKLSEYRFKCGYCNERTNSREGLKCYHPNDHLCAWVYICPSCQEPNYFKGAGKEIQLPVPKAGRDIPNLEKTDVGKIYEEARKAHSAGAHSACVMCCRVILAYVAVEQKAKIGLKFAAYVKYICDNNLIGKNLKGMAETIIKVGNKANHEIEIIAPKQSAEIIEFCEMLLMSVYGYSHLMPKK